ncbi:MAG TPA: Hpt domain-containing protein, partial [Kofleriaceae bacterium]|nr:Hpt domain-containing protein [Kofleriaceae bacterium]
MSTRREALIARYRVLSLERIRAIRARLDEVAAGNAEALAEVRRELHTLKGDSHLLGLVPIGRVAHACEERLADSRGTADAARALARALDAVRLALRDEASDQAAIDERLSAALVELSAPPDAAATNGAPPPAAATTPAAPPPAAAAAGEPPGPATAPAPPAADGKDAPAATDVAQVGPGARRTTAGHEEASRWIHVSARDVDLVCERLSALHADLGKIHAALRGLASTSRDTMHDLERVRADLDEIVSSAWALRL